MTTIIFSLSIPWWGILTGLGVVLGTLALIVVVVGSWLLNLLNLPGNWLLLGVTMTFALLVPYEDDRRLTVSWTVVIVLAGLAVLGEILEFAAGAWGASRAGASRQGTTLALIGSIVGGLIGVAIGLPVPVVGPVIAALLFAGVGAMAGGILGERWTGRSWTVSLNVGHAAFWGRLCGTLGKIIVGAVMVALVFGSILLKPF